MTDAARPPNYQVYAIRYATREGRRQDNFIGGDPHDGPMPMDYFCWLAIGPQRRFVIDCGFTAEVSARRKRTYLRNPVEALALFDIRAEDVEDVILTHLHYDHVGNFDRFPKARFHLQEPELAYATGKYMRHPFLSHAFEVEDVVGMVRLNYRGRVVFHSGDAELAPGLRLHLAGGTRRGCSSSASIPSAAGWCWLLTSPITTRTWKAAGRSPRPSISATRWKATTSCARWRQAPSISCRGMIPW